MTFYKSANLRSIGIIQPFLLSARKLLQQARLAQLVWDESVDVLPGLELR